MTRLRIIGASFVLLVAVPILAQISQEPVDLDGIYRIKDEGLNRSQVMETLSYLTDVYGPRLTGSPQIKAAAEWTKKKLMEWELANVNLESWGPFGRGWSNERFNARAVSPDTSFPLIAYPKAWTPGTDGAVEADVATAIINNDEDFEKFRGQLRGKFVMITAMRDVPAEFQAPGRRFTDEDLNSFNIIGEIPGTDKADELVMLGAHFDSWHSGTGATDNAAGSAVMLEAIRILKATHLKMRRTVRLALWTGEEEGILGSRAYVTQHFADRADMKLKPDHAKFSGYFNVDNGTGAIRGIYLQGNEAVAPIFKAWMQPFKNVGMTTLAIRNTGGTDHLSFDAVGLPGFQFIQDPVEYGSRTHHSNMDVYERIQAPDMMKNAVVVASFVYLTANRNEKLPRKPLPAPQK